MKYARLYDLVRKSDKPIIIDLAKYPQQIAQPATGYAAAMTTDDWGIVLITKMDESKNQEWFDTMMGKALTQYPSSYLSLQVIGDSPVYPDYELIVFNIVWVTVNKSYAMGFAHGAGHGTVYDIGAGRFIHRKA